LYGYGSVSTVNLVGARTLGASWTRNAGPPVYYSIASPCWEIIKKVTTTVTQLSQISAVRIMTGASAYRQLLILEITKGSPNYSFKFFHPASGPPVDVTDALFLQVMESASLDSPPTMPSAYTATASSGAMSEAAGALNNIFVYWERTSYNFCFNVRHRMVS
jgi:hypothetical protein